MARARPILHVVKKKIGKLEKSNRRKEEAETSIRSRKGKVSCTFAIMERKKKVFFKYQGPKKKEFYNNFCGVGDSRQEASSLPSFLLLLPEKVWQGRDESEAGLQHPHCTLIASHPMEEEEEEKTFVIILRSWIFHLTIFLPPSSSSLAWMHGYSESSFPGEPSSLSPSLPSFLLLLKRETGVSE